MSRFSLRAFSVLFAVLVTTGCWEQWSETWFPQMKWQKAVQAFERVEWNGQVEGFLPPEGSVPVNAAPPEYGRLDLAEAGRAVQNPIKPQRLPLHRSAARNSTACTARCVTASAAWATGR